MTFWNDSFHDRSLCFMNYLRAITRIRAKSFGATPARVPNTREYSIPWTLITFYDNNNNLFRTRSRRASAEVDPLFGSSESESGKENFFAEEVLKVIQAMPIHWRELKCE